MVVVGQQGHSEGGGVVMVNNGESPPRIFMMDSNGNCLMIPLYLFNGKLQPVDVEGFPGEWTRGGIHLWRVNLL